MVVRQQRRVAVREEVGVAGCDTEGVVRVAEQFAERALEMARLREAIKRFLDGALS